MIPKNKKILFILVVLLVAAIFGLLPAPAHAIDVLGWIGGKAIGGAIYIINYIIGFIGGIFFTLASLLVDWALLTNKTVAQSPVVIIGWTIARDLANLGFVLAILIIAFGTALRSEKYGMKKTLGKLIVIALLINFSLTIAGVFIDFTGVITDFFISRASGGGVLSFASTLATAFNPQALLNKEPTEKLNASTTEVESTSIANFGSALFTQIASVFFAVFFTIAATISMFALAVMLFIRYIYLTILLVLMPLAWLCFAIPDLSKHWEKWWSQFFRWIFFAPITSFFLYLAIYVTSATGKANPNNPITQIEGMGSNPSAADQNFRAALAGTISNPLAVIGQMVAVIGLLIGGLIAANSLGIIGAAAFAGKGGVFGKIGKGISGWASRKGTQIGTAIPRAKPIQSLTEKMQTAGAGKGFVKRTLGAPVRALGTGMSKWQQKGENLVAGAQKDIEKLSPQERKNLLFSPTTPKYKQAAILESLRKDAPKLLGEIPNLQNYFSTLRAYGKNEKDYTKLIPTLDKDVQRELKAGNLAAAQTAIDQLLDKFTPEDYGKIQFEAVKKTPSAMNLILRNVITNDQSGALAQIYKTASRTERGDLDKSIKAIISMRATSSGLSNADWLKSKAPKLNKWQGKSAMPVDWGL